VLFFWPQGIAVIELAHRFPGEGGVYLWAKEVLRRLPRFSLRLVLLDEQHDVRADDHALFRRRVSSLFWAPGTNRSPTTNPSP